MALQIIIEVNINLQVTLCTHKMSKDKSFRVIQAFPIVERDGGWVNDVFI